MRPPLRTAAVALASFATLALELLLTRILSVTLYYHFAFLVISLALLGLAVSGVVLSLRPRTLASPRPGALAGLAMVGFAITTPLALRVTLASPISLSRWSGDLGMLAGLYLAALVPFLCSGVALTVAIAAARERIGRIYAFDLAGAALGCGFVLVALPALGGPGAVVAVGALGAASAALFALSDAPGSSTRGGRALAGVALGLAGLLGAGAATEQAAHRFGLARNPKKFLGQRKVLLERWNALSQITVGVAGTEAFRWIFIDADAATRMWSRAALGRDGAALAAVPEIRLAALGYALPRRGPALVIGPGGGTDVLSALTHGVERVVGVEVNPIIVDTVMRDRFADFNGHLYDDPRVRIVTDEGRSFIRRSPERYAFIQATLVDTWAASTSGAFTLSENNLYTVEAFEEFVDHLTPDGLLLVTRWYDERAPRELLRLVALGRAALERRGVAADRVARHVLVATDGERRATLLLAREPFSAADLRRLGERAAADRLRFLVSPDPAATTPPRPAGAPPARPGSRGESLLAGLLRAPSAEAYLAALPFDASPTTDERPYFFYSLRPSQLPAALGALTHVERNNLGLAILALVLALSTALTVLFVVGPLALARRAALREERRVKLRLLAYFLCLGLAFILVELGLMQRLVLFLGHPIYALAVVLATLLCASGAGSALSGRGAARWGARGLALRATGALAALLVAYALGLGPLFHRLLALPLAGRVAITALLVALPGLGMGALLPSGMRLADRFGPALVAWGWGLNGAASVLGSVLAVLLSLNVGFSAVLLVGVGIYGLGALALPALAERPS